MMMTAMITVNSDMEQELIQRKGPLKYILQYELRQLLRVMLDCLEQKKCPDAS